MKSRKQSIRNLITSIKPYSGEMSLAVISSLLKQAAVICSVALTSYIVGIALEGTLTDQVYWLLAALIVCILLRALANYGEMWLAHDVAFRVIRNFRLDLYLKISELSPAYTMRRKTGQLGQAVISDVEVLELFLAHTFSGFLVAVIITGAIMAILFFINPLFSLLLLMAAILMGMIPYSMRKRADRQGTDVREKLADNNSLLVENVQGMREIITLNGKESFKKRILTGMDELYQAQEVYGRRKGAEGMMTQILCGCFTVTVMSLAAFLVAQGKIAFSMYPVAVMLSSVVLSPVIEVAQVAQELGLVFASSDRIQEVLTAKPVVQDTGKEKCNHTGCDVEFQNVEFGYDSRGESSVLHNVSFRIRNGETVVLVGHSGAGKTTCANLLLRYWDPQKGSVKIGGRDIRGYSMESLRQTVCAIQQETYLFHTTIQENIRMGYPEATDAQVEAAVKAANAHAFISALPEGYNTVTGERGFRLSGGQRQRIAIARALLKDAPVVIFDEAVSNLDTENERYIQNTLKTQLKGKTVLIIAHRLSTILAADRIVMLDNGCIVADGTHEELLHQCPQYRELIGSQLL